MKELVLYLAKSLVEQPEKVEVEAAEENEVVKFNLKVAEEDKGRIIGKQGRVIKAMRSLLQVSGAKANKKVVLEVL